MTQKKTKSGFFSIVGGTIVLFILIYGLHRLILYVDKLLGF